VTTRARDGWPRGIEGMHDATLAAIDRVVTIEHLREAERSSESVTPSHPLWPPPLGGAGTVSAK
jgi:hypothetical protein